MVTSSEKGKNIIASVCWTGSLGHDQSRIMNSARFCDNLLNRGQLQKPIIRSSLLTVIFPFEFYFRESMD